MSVFGWSYPPGCSGPDDREPEPRTLREAREMAGLSLREMARQVGVSPSYLSGVERGDFRICDDRLSNFEEAYKIRFRREPTVEQLKAEIQFLTRVAAALSKPWQFNAMTPYFDGEGPSVPVTGGNYPLSGDLLAWMEEGSTIPEPGWVPIMQPKPEASNE